MATRSFIGILNQDSTVNYIYCHFDGYPSYMLPMLTHNYNTEEEVRELLGLGDISVLKPLVSPPEGEEHSFHNPHPFTTIAYHRDRGDYLLEKSTISESLYSRQLLGNNGIDYGYLFKDGEWIVL